MKQPIHYTQVADGHVADEVFQQAREHFDEEELVDLPLAAVAINGWHRIALSSRSAPGTDQPRAR